MREKEIPSVNTELQSIDRYGIGKQREGKDGLDTDQYLVGISYNLLDVGVADVLGWRVVGSQWRLRGDRQLIGGLWVPLLIGSNDLASLRVGRRHLGLWLRSLS